MAAKGPYQREARRERERSGISRSQMSGRPETAENGIDDGARKMTWAASPEVVDPFRWPRFRIRNPDLPADLDKSGLARTVRTPQLEM